jgi:hypothetical protein
MFGASKPVVSTLTLTRYLSSPSQKRWSVRERSKPGVSPQTRPHSWPQEAPQESAVLVPDLRAAGSPVERQLLLDPIEQILVDDRLVLAGMELVLVAYLARVGRIGQQEVQAGLVEGPAAQLFPVAGHAALAHPSASAQFLDDRQQRRLLEVHPEDLANAGGFLGVDDQPRAGPAVVDVVAQHRRSAGPFALAGLRREFVADPLADDLTLELGEAQQDVQGQAAHRMGRVELLGNGDERDALPVERLHDAGEVEQGPAEPIDLVDDDAVDLAGLDVPEEPVEGGPLHVAAGVAAIVVVVGQYSPALRLLAGDVRLGGVALCVERVVFLVEPFVGGLARVDRAADRRPSRLAFLAAHRCTPSRKKRKPLMWLPVIRLATADSVR